MLPIRIHNTEADDNQPRLHPQAYMPAAAAVAYGLVQTAEQRGKGALYFHASLYPQGEIRPGFF